MIFPLKRTTTTTTTHTQWQLNYYILLFFVLFAFLWNILTVFLFLFFLILSMRIRNHGEYKKSDHHRRGVFIFPFKEENKTAHSGAENSRCAVRFFPFWLATTRTDRKGTQKCCSSFLFCASSSSSSISVIRSDWETLKQLYRFGKERKRQDAHPRPRTWDFHTLMPGRTHGILQIQNKRISISSVVP